jgi:hypothetical protein
MAYSYPDWLTEAIVKAYKSGISVAEISVTVAIPEASIRWKLTREGVYISKSSKKKTLPETSAEAHGF